MDENSLGISLPLQVPASPSSAERDECVPGGPEAAQSRVPERVGSEGDLPTPSSTPSRFRILQPRTFLVPHGEGTCSSHTALSLKTGSFLPRLSLGKFSPLYKLLFSLL